MADQLAEREPTEAQGKAAHEVDQRIKALIRQMRLTWLQIAEQLYTFVELKMWRAVGVKSFEDWLKDPEVEIKRRQAFYLLEIWRELVVRRGVEPAALQNLTAAKLAEVLPAIRRGYLKVDEAIVQCETLSREDLRELSRISTQRALAPAGSEPLDADMETEWAVCETCGSRYRVRGS